MAEKEIGKITHYFSKINVGIIELTGDVRVGDKIHIKGAVTDFTQEIESMQINHQDVNEGKAGDGIGIKLKDKVRENDLVYLVEE